MSTLPRPANIGYYAVAKSHNGGVLIASGPHDGSEAPRLVDTVSRPEAHRRALAFVNFGVARIVVAPRQPPPTFTVPARSPA